MIQVMFRAIFQVICHAPFRVICRATVTGILLLWSLTTLGQVPVYDVKVEEKVPFDRRNFVQGLEFNGKELLVSSGNYGESMLRVYDWPAMTLSREKPVPAQYFAEGLTQIGGRLFVLTWKARQLLVYEAATLESLGSARIPGEGWGMTHAGDQLYFSDGSHRLHSVDAVKGGTIEVIDVTLNGRPVSRLNELEWVNGEIWANVWGSNQIVRIDPDSGVVTGIIDLKGLLPREDRESDTDVLNGIAVHPDTGAIWVTGKRWPWIFRVTLEAR